MTLNAGVIGLGVGRQHIAGYNMHPQCEVTALCDCNEDVLEAVTAVYPGVRTTTEADEILTDPAIDIVSVASYDNYHYEQIVKALDHEKHVFVEKPLCLFAEEARDIRRRLDEKPHLQLSSNLILRKCPRFMKLKDMIRNGELGELFHVEGDYNYGRLHKITEGWRGTIDFYSVIYGGAVHIVDLLLWLTDDEIVEVAGYGNRIAARDSRFKYNDSVTSVMKFKSGITGRVSVHYGCMRPHFHGLSLYGTGGTFVNAQGNASFYTSNDPNVDAVRMTEGYPDVHKGDLLNSFIDAIVDGSRADVSKDDVFKTMSVCFAMEHAATNGCVKVEYI